MAYEYYKGRRFLTAEGSLTYKTKDPKFNRQELKLDKFHTEIVQNLKNGRNQSLEKLA